VGPLLGRYRWGVVTAARNEFRSATMQALRARKSGAQPVEHDVRVAARGRVRRAGARPGPGTVTTPARLPRTAL